MKQSEAWVMQLRSDFVAGQRVLIDGNDTTYCQAMAKYQQTVEKSVKAMVAAVNELGISFTTVTASHQPDREMEALIRLRRAIDNTSVEALARIFNKHRQAIEYLCQLAPKWPEPGKPFPRNTEYPFNAQGEWAAPATPGSFRLDEVRSAEKTARVFHRNAMRFVNTVRRGRT